MQKLQLKRTAQQLVEKNKGILAIDESPQSMEKKFHPLSIENNVENRRRYREVLLTLPSEVSAYLGGVILNEETFFQQTASGESFVAVMAKNGVLPGVKLDKGLLPLSEGNPEQMSTGLDDLGARCQKYQEGGAAFAKWRSVFHISKSHPSEECIYTNCNILSEYALVCQKNGLVPVVEPEVLFDGTHNIEACKVVTASVISCLFYHLNRKGVYIPGMLLKVGFVTSGSANGRESLQEVADATVEAFLSSIPPSLPGVVFLSGGHPEDVSVQYLEAVNRVKRERQAPWSISYSFGRALQDSALKLWNNDDQQKAAAQELLVQRAALCSQAVRGLPSTPTSR